MELSAVRQVLVDLVGVLLAELLDRLQRELLVVRHRDVLGVLGQDSYREKEVNYESRSHLLCFLPLATSLRKKMVACSYEGK